MRLSRLNFKSISPFTLTAARLCFLLFIGLYLHQVVVADEPLREVRGTVYYTNNTPPNLDRFPVQLVTTNKKTRVVETTLNKSGQFRLTNIKPGKYLLKVSNLNDCTLLYRIDVRRKSLTNVRIIMDAACAHINHKISDLDK
jgi:hypothetical protein